MPVIGPVLAGAAIGSSLFGKKKKYNPPNLDFLRTANYDVNPYEILNRSREFRGSLSEGNDPYFRDYLGSISAPSSVEEVQRGVEGQRLQDTLGDIERTTKGRFGEEFVNQYLRGLAGGGAGSDIAGNALAQVGAQGGRAASEAYTNYALSDLQRQAAQEQAMRDAFLRRYGIETGTGQYATGLASDFLTGNATRRLNRDTNLASLLSGQAATAYGGGPSRSPLDDFLSAFAGQGGSMFGERAFS